MANTAQKDTIYIDVDDEITSIVDKIQGSTAKVVALVLPKRAAGLQSIVNMKLLKRAAEDSNKTIVLITSEAGLLPLAGAVGLYTAKNLQSKPEIPAGPANIPSSDDIAEVEELDPDTPVGELAGDDKPTDEPTKTPKEKKPKTKGSDKKPKVPNFEKFRLKLILGILGVILLIGLWYFAVFVSPSASVVVTADGESVNTSVEFTARTTANTANIKNRVIPATLVETSKEDSQTVAATGEKDLGAKATGTVTLSMDCDDASGGFTTVPAGTGVSAEGLTFITQSNTTLNSPDVSNGCKFTGSTKVTAQNKGERYNIAATSYSVSGYSDVSGVGTAMTGGSSKIAKIVSQSDVDSATDKLNTSEEGPRNELSEELDSDDLYAINDSFQKSNESTDVSPGVGKEASEVKVTYSADYSMLGVSQEDLDELLKDSIKDEVDTDKQAIQDNGLSSASFTISNVQSDGSATITVDTTVVVGPDINEAELKEEIAGKKQGESENIISASEGVTEVQVNLSPFWASKVPSNPDKITFEIKQAE